MKKTKFVVKKIQIEGLTKKESLLCNSFVELKKKSTADV